MSLIAYLTWDPNPSLFDFNLPLLNRPILWYGFLFAFGFFLGYLILTYLLRRYFLRFVEFRKEDVASWPGLIQILGAKRLFIAQKIQERLSHIEVKQCKEWKVGDQISEELKEGILRGMNRLIADRSVRLDRPLSSFGERLCRFAKKRGDDEEPRKRLQLEEELGAVVFSIKQRTMRLAEHLTFYVIIGALIGSRLGDLLFYQNWIALIHHPLSLIAVWEGGLASHGGAVGILVAIGIFASRWKIPFWTVVDFAVIPTALAAVCIRIGNFFNQEILGIPTTLPWGVLFLHPADGGAIVPRHPAQLYEALWYLCTFGILLFYWHRSVPFERRGKLTGLFLLLVFGFRFGIEWIKVEQSVWLSPESLLTMGQYLSIPFVILGGFLFFRRSC